MEGGHFTPTGLDLDVLARNFILVLRGEGEGGHFTPTGLDLDVLARNFILVLRGEGVKNGDSKKQRERSIKGLLGLAAVIKKSDLL
jgi:hypothetical protein